MIEKRPKPTSMTRLFKRTRLDDFLDVFVLAVAIVPIVVMVVWLVASVVIAARCG